jgi:hypothetical protein
MYCEKSKRQSFLAKADDKKFMKSKNVIEAIFKRNCTKHLRCFGKKIKHKNRCFRNPKVTLHFVLDF